MKKRFYFMKKIVVSTIMASAILLTGCSHKTNYKVKKEQYDELCNYESYLPKMNSLNFTVTVRETVGDKNYEYITKFDNGKVESITSYSTFYVVFEKGSYNSENQTFNYEGYFEEEGTWAKSSYQNETMPDDIYLPDVGFILTYDELEYNSETHYYEQIAESKTLNDYYVYSEVKVQFVDGKVTYISHKYKNTFEPEKEHLTVVEITDYGSTKVNLPNVQ